jgi:STE24 endopeptidase
MRRFPRHWWAPASACVTAFAVISIWLFPVVIDPLFNKFEALEPGTLRDQVLTLAEEAEVSVGEVYLVDASRRTTAANAYVGGLGKTKRVVLYDNLVKGFPQDQVKMVVAHELAHQKHRDLLRGLAWLALVAPAATLLVQRLTELFGRPAGPAALPGLALALTLVSFGVGAASNVLSRQVEARADAFSIDLTEDPAAHIALERRLAVRNISDPDPPRLLHGLLGTHPTTAQRIGIGAAWARER